MSESLKEIVRSREFVYSKMKEQVDFSVYNKIDELRYRVRDQVWNEVRDRVWDKVFAESFISVTFKEKADE